ncbi:hypothetical protein AQUCO_02000179v1 [Aquilegia coerulea]|uniref:Myb/SANT-like DNA-binding domain-containing protein n=1 Tax=Aquilegia coerulea TaxID=218851 RepID=A0A2G5DH40_AQUCA|nr:hypothetical protein AQUCO_02000179v1 [Aquilegia coerulea]
MDDTEDDARYPPNPYSSNYHQNHVSSHRPKLPVRNAPYNEAIGNEYGEEEDDDDDEEEEEEEIREEEVGEEAEEEGDEEDMEEEENGGQQVVEEPDEDEDDDDEEEEEKGEGAEDEFRDEDEDGGNFYQRREIDEDSERHAKKRKLKNLAFGYEFAPRVATPSAATTSAPKPSFGGGRHSPADWTENATFILLDAWGDRFLQLGRKSLRSDEWHEVAKKVSQLSKSVRTDTQCRNRLDTLKKKYKKEKMMLADTGETSSKWVYYKKMDMLMTSASSRQPGLSCGLDSGEYVFMNPKSYLNRSNGLDEMRDSPGNSESSEGNGEESDGLPPKRTRSVETNHGRSSFRLLADSIQKFGEIYEKIENSKRQQMVELEKMRMDFHRDLEMQKRQIMERAHAEIAKIRQGDDEEIDVSTENTSG